MEGQRKADFSSKYVAGFSGNAVICSVLGITALTLAVIPWFLFVFYPFVGGFGILPAVLSVPAGVVGAVFAVMAYRDVGAAASASRTLTLAGTLCCVFALTIVVIWLTIFFTGSDERFSFPVQEDYGITDPHEIAEAVKGISFTDGNVSTC